MQKTYALLICVEINQSIVDMILDKDNFDSQFE